MKHFLFLFFFTYTTISFSQIENQLLSYKHEEFDSFAKPNKTNNLSKFFTKRIDSDLLDPYKIKDTIKKKKNVYLTFKFDESNKVTKVIVNSPYSELNKSIREAFKDYDIENLNIPEKSPLNTYVLQILSREGDKMVINCSTNVVYDRLPIFEGCESSVNKLKLSNCFYKKISEHIVNTISPAEIKRAKVLGMLNLRVKFLVNEQGAIEQINCKAPTDSLTQELNRVVALFPKAKSPATRNGKPTSYIYEKTIGFQVDSDNEKYKEEIETKNEGLVYSKDTLLNPNSELALHFKNYISPEELNKIVFPLKKQSIYLSFNIDKKGKPIDIKTNSEKAKLNDRLVEIFNKFPFEKLNIKSSTVVESYRYPIIIESFNKNIIISKDEPTVYTPPFFDKNCENSNSPDQLYDCLNQNIKDIVISKFKNSIKYKTTITNSVKISCAFLIDANGKIINVKASAPNPIICNELEQIIKNITKVYKPAYLNGKAVTTTYRYSFRFNFSENKIDDFQNLVRTYYSRGSAN
ncbi:MAG: hypothetical protein V4572_00025 [Bacteroidota bacterium]